MEKKIKIKEGINVKKEGTFLVFTKGGKTNKREVFHPLIKVDIKDNHVILSTKKENRKLKKLLNSLTAHVKNLILGLDKSFIYKLKICGSHFPITVKVEGNLILISNYLGEKVPRKCKIVGDAKVKVEKDIITVESSNKEYAGMTAGIIEKTGQIRMHDRRIFQDGIYIIEKAGRKV